MKEFIKEFNLYMCMDKTKGFNFGMDEDTSTSDQKQTNQQEETESQKEALHRCIKYLVHASQCRQRSKCESSSCMILREILQHLKSCKQKKGGGCLICKHLISLCHYHSKSCEKTRCYIPFCRNSRVEKIKRQMWEQLQKNRELLRSQATMKNRGMFNAVPETRPGNYSSSQPSHAMLFHSSLQPGITKKPSTGPPVGALQAVQQVQVAAAKQTAPYMIAASMSYGKGNPFVSPPTANTDLVATHQMQTHIPISQMMSGVPNCILNMGNVASGEGSDFAQNSQPYQNLHPQLTPQMGIGQQAQIMRPGSMPDSIETSAVGYSNQIMPNPGPSLGGMQRPTQAWQQLVQTSVSSLCSATTESFACLKI